MSGLLRSNLSVAAGTALSRLTGLVRVAVLGAVLGSPSALADAYDLANGTPNMIYELLIGGILSSSLVPLFTRLDEDNDHEGRSAVVSVAVVMMAIITVASVLLAPLIFRLYSLLTADGIDADQYRQVGTLLARMFLVQIFFYGLNALATSLLNARDRFFAAAWVPALANVVIVGSLLLVPSVTDDQVPTLADVLDGGSLSWLLGGGATVGIAVMALALVIPLVRSGVRLHFRPDFRHPAVRRLRNLSGWALGYVAANQVTIVVVRNLLRGGDGSIFSYSRAYLWFVLPHGLLAVSIATTFLPKMSRAVVRNEPAELVRHGSIGIRLVALVTIPASIGLFVLRRSIIGAAFEHGNVTSFDALQTSRALAGFALGLAGFSVYLFVLRIFYAQHDARTPFLLNLVENALNIALAILLVDRYGLLGMGLAFGLAYIGAAALAMVVLERKVSEFPFIATLTGLARMAIAATAMGFTMWPIARAVGANTGIDAVIRIAVSGSAGVVVYLATLLTLRSPELRSLRRLRAE